MRFMPRTLAAQMIVLVLVGLVLVLVLNTTIDMLDRGKAFYRGTTLQMAERIADVAKTLDAVRPEERVKIAQRLNSDGLRIALSQAPQISEADRPFAQAFRDMVSHDLGAGATVKVRLHSMTPPNDLLADSLPGAPVNSIERFLTLRESYLFPRSFSFVTDVKLNDGNWVTLSAPLPYDTITRFYVLLPKLALMLAAMIVVLTVAARWITRPMSKLAQAALALGHDLDQPPIRETGAEEIRTTARALNVMQLQIQEHVRERAAMLAALSHDFKTYITRLRLRGELLPAGVHRDRLIADVGEMATMVDATLDYLHGVSSPQCRAQFDAMALAESVRIDAEDLGWTVDVSGSAGRPYYGNAQELRRCLMNLVENAVKYGGRAGIHLEDSASELTIRVCDPGPGIPPAERERVFEAFYRSASPQARDLGGTGLGLNIARTIARDHGGDITLENGDPSGFCAAIHLARDLAHPTGA